MKQVVGFLVGVALVAASPAALVGQSLGDVARQEESRRKRVSKPGKLYTNESLRGSDAAAPAGAAPGSGSAGSASAASPSTPASPAPEETPADPGPKKDQKYWRDRMTQARDNLERSKSFDEALQSRINALRADFTSRDDPAQRAVIGNNLQKALGDLERVQGEITKYEKQITDIEEEARRAGVPPGWLR